VYGIDVQFSDSFELLYEWRIFCAGRLMEGSDFGGMIGR
jgi:hypothetical protein